MKVYKYRGSSTLKRDCEGLEQSYFYAPTAEFLNDPTEVVLNDRLVKVIASTLSSTLESDLEEFTSMRRTAGIYSLSKTVTDELMWAHYAESHKGYCVEYDLSRLVLDARNQWSQVNVKYSSEPPTLSIQDVVGELGETNIVEKLVGFKSQRWEYEDEIRLVTTRAGSNHYAQAAVTGIYFGCRCEAKTRETVRKALSGRGHSYFQMKYPEASYQLTTEAMPRLAIDREVLKYEAPIEESAVTPVEDLGKFSGLHSKLTRAVKIVRRDPSCRAIVLADVSRSGERTGLIYVQYKTRVKTDLNEIVTWYFSAKDLE